MRLVLRLILAGLALAWLASLQWSGAAADKDAPKYDISEVMQMAHKGGLLKKVIEGKPSKADKADLLDMYVALSKNKPPKGNEKSWKDKTSAMVAGAKAVAADEKDAQAKLKKIVDCKACHDLHKGG